MEKYFLSYGAVVLSAIFFWGSVPAYGYSRFFLDNAFDSANTDTKLEAFKISSCQNTDCSNNNTVLERTLRNPANNRLNLRGRIRAEFDDKFRQSPNFIECVAKGGCKSINGNYYADELRLRRGTRDSYTLNTCSGLTVSAMEHPGQKTFVIYTSYQSLDPSGFIDSNNIRVIVDAVVEGCDFQ
ncbi:MAG: hypothetical protein FJ112_11670 [Deltaproteobacteria bacterium]|nr:hypothetical protein [Deltaproteobacteria bacterium]